MPTNSRRLEGQGRWDEYGDPLPEGVARISLTYRARDARHHITLDYAEAVMLANELERAMDKIKKNRRVRFGGVLSR